MSAIKKLPVPFDPIDPEWNPKDFLIPSSQDDRLIMVGLKDGIEYEFGRIVFIGEPIDAQDIYERLVECRGETKDPEGTRRLLTRYVDALQVVRIGNVVRIKEDAKGHMEVEVVSKTPSSFGRRK